MNKALSRIFVAMTLLFALTACSDDDKPENKLSQPALTATDVTKTSFTVEWTAVENASAYVYTVDGGAEQTTTSLSFTQIGLTPNTTYSVKVKAIDDSGVWTESAFSTLSITTEDGPLTNFEITVSDITAYTARISVAPSEASKYYWYTLLTEEEKNSTETTINELMRKDIDSFIKKYTNPDKNPDAAPGYDLTIKQMLETYGGIGAKANFCPVRKKKALKPGTSYYVAAVYVDPESGNFTSEPELVEGSAFTTLASSLPWYEAKMSLGMSSTGQQTSNWVKIDWLAFGGRTGKFLVATKIETEAMIAKGYTYEKLVEDFGNEVSENSFNVFDMLGFPMSSNYDDCTERTDYVGMLMIRNDQGKVYWHGEITTDPISDENRRYPTTISNITDNNATATFAPKNAADTYWIALVSDEDIMNGIQPFDMLESERNKYINQNPGMSLADVLTKYSLHGNQTLDLSSRFGALKPGMQYRLAVVTIETTSGNLKTFRDIELYYFTTTGASKAQRKTSKRFGMQPTSVKSMSR